MAVSVEMDADDGSGARLRITADAVGVKVSVVPGDRQSTGSFVDRTTGLVPIAFDQDDFGDATAFITRAAFRLKERSAALAAG